MARRSMTFVLLVALVTRALASACADDRERYSRRVIAAARAAGPVAVDGSLDEACWQSAPRAEAFIDGIRQQPAADQTTALIVYDETFIYVGFRCLDSRPDGIVARETVRDSRYANDAGGEDSVELVLDPFRTYRWDDAARFSVNALGTPSARISGGRAAKTEWKGDWDAAARRTPTGWQAEMRIPWRILTYPSGGGRVTMGINFSRWQERTKTGSIWSWLGPLGHSELEGLWADVSTPSAAFRPELSMLPYLLPQTRAADGGLRAGLDVRYTLTPQMTMVGALNPDFATIEGAVEGIAFSRSERFIPEKRPFFLEGRDYFGAGDSYALGPYFYTQRIAAFDVGVKAYGKIGPRDTLGALATADFGGESNLVARWRRELSATSSAGAFYTEKAAGADRNAVGVLTQDARWGKLGLASQWAASAGRDAGGGAGQVNLTYGDTNNFTSLQVVDVSPRFRDANGLIFFSGYKGFSLYDNWHVEWRKGPLRSFNLDVGPTCNWHSDGRPFQRGGFASVFLESRDDWGVGLDGGYTAFDGQIDSTYGLVLIGGLSNRFRRYGGRVSTGRLGSAPATFVGPFCSMRAMRGLDIAYDGAIQNLNGVEQQHILTLNYEISPTRSIGGRVVLQGANTNWYLSYRHSGMRGTELFLMLGDPNAARFVGQAAMKLVFAL